MISSQTAVPHATVQSRMPTSTRVKPKATKLLTDFAAVVDGGGSTLDYDVDALRQSAYDFGQLSTNAETQANFLEFVKTDECLHVPERRARCPLRSSTSLPRARLPDSMGDAFSDTSADVADALKTTFDIDDELWTDALGGNLIEPAIPATMNTV